MIPHDSTSSVQRIAIVGCGAAKRDEPNLARDLYSSGYFTLKRRYAEQHCDDWRILSAKHGLLDPDREVEPYDASLSSDADSYIGEDGVAAWVASTRAELQSYLDRLGYPTVVILAGESYAGRLESVFDESDASVGWPFRRAELGGLHDQMAWLSEETSSS